MLLIFWGLIFRIFHILILLQSNTIPFSYSGFLPLHFPLTVFSWSIIFTTLRGRTVFNSLDVAKIIWRKLSKLIFCQKPNIMSIDTFLALSRLLHFCLKFFKIITLEFSLFLFEVVLSLNFYPNLTFFIKLTNQLKAQPSF